MPISIIIIIIITSVYQTKINRVLVVTATVSNMKSMDFYAFSLVKRYQLYFFSSFRPSIHYSLTVRMYIIFI